MNPEFDIKQYLKSMVFLIKMYNDCLRIVNDPTTPLDELIKAKKLNEGGFYEFVNRMMIIGNPNEEESH